MEGVLDLALVRRLEAHAADAWPATITERVDGGWLLRATPGLDRGRNNTALTPCRALEGDEIAPALERIDAFANAHRIRPGIQVSPLALHEPLQHELDRRGWDTQWPTLVLAARTERIEASLELAATDHATPAWLQAWARCEGRKDAEAHAATVFELLRGKARFAQFGDVAVGISVAADGIVGLFCLAVAPERRRTGLGTGLVRSLIAQADVETAYLQVWERNEVARAMYALLGFSEVYRYVHRIGPP
jgi:ribosomal protein S18 acetylase RimI-like enzyme